MARIVFGAYLTRYPLGGCAFNNLHYLQGLIALGHDVYLVEKATYPDACFDPRHRVNGDDASYGVAFVNELFDRFGLRDHWSFRDLSGQWFGLDETRVAELFRTADVFIDHGSHGAWNEEATSSGIRVLIDGEPGFRQISMLDRGVPPGRNEYDHYFTVGRNVGTPASTAPDTGNAWRPFFHPVAVDLIRPGDHLPDAPFTTIMNWRSHAHITYNGETFGQKDSEFETYRRLPSLTTIPLELAVAGSAAPIAELRALGWHTRNAIAVTASYDSFLDYIAQSAGEFAFPKQIFVALNTAWFSDRSAAYLASGRPVVVGETGFSAHLPVGTGLFAVRSATEAVEALDQIHRDYRRHSTAARDIAREFLDAPRVMGQLLEQIGLPARAIRSSH